MHAKIWFIGLTVGMTFVGYAAAASVTTQGLDDSGHAASHDSHARLSSGDSLALGSDTSSHTSSDSSDSSSNAGSTYDHSADVLPGPTPSAAAHHAHLGWQSLLPGSIQ